MRKILLFLSAMFLLLGSVIAQNRVVTGKVTDEKGNPLSNVSIIIKGSIFYRTMSYSTFSLRLKTHLKFSHISDVRQGAGRNCGVREWGGTAGTAAGAEPRAGREAR